MASRETHASAGRNHHSGGPGPAPLEQPFGPDDLYALRAAVSAHAARLGAPPDRVTHLVIVAGELASNVIRHGGGRGHLRLSRVDGAVRCEVSDDGPGIADVETIGTVQPPAMATGGRGLFIVRRLSTSVKIDSTARGTTVTALLADS